MLAINNKISFSLQVLFEFIDRGTETLRRRLERQCTQALVRLTHPLRRLRSQLKQKHFDVDDTNKDNNIINCSFTFIVCLNKTIER